MLYDYPCNNLCTPILDIQYLVSSCLLVNDYSCIARHPPISRNGSIYYFKYKQRILETQLSIIKKFYGNSENFIILFHGLERSTPKYIRTMSCTNNMEHARNFYSIVS